MLTPQKIAAMKRIKEEYQELNSNPIANIGVTVGLVNENNIFEWTVSLIGPKDTSYSGGLFILNIKFPDNYPETQPEVCFKTPIYHVNINPKKSLRTGPGVESLGHVCISTLNWWKPFYKMREVLTNIFGLFYMANPDSPYGAERADEFRNNKKLHEEKIQYFTKKYADPRNQKYFDGDWDFSYNL